jgi:hypothetical protein
MASGYELLKRYREDPSRANKLALAEWAWENRGTDEGDLVVAALKGGPTAGLQARENQARGMGQTQIDAPYEEDVAGNGIVSGPAPDGSLWNNFLAAAERGGETSTNLVAGLMPKSIQQDWQKYGLPSKQKQVEELSKAGIGGLAGNVAETAMGMAVDPTQVAMLPLMGGLGPAALGAVMAGQSALEQRGGTGEISPLETGLAFGGGYGMGKVFHGVGEFTKEMNPLKGLGVRAGAMAGWPIAEQAVTGPIREAAKPGDADWGKYLSEQYPQELAGAAGRGLGMAIGGEVVNRAYAPVQQAGVKAQIQKTAQKIAGEAAKVSGGDPSVMAEAGYQMAQEVAQASKFAKPEADLLTSSVMKSVRETITLENERIKTLDAAEQQKIAADRKAAKDNFVALKAAKLAAETEALQASLATPQQDDLSRDSIKKTREQQQVQDAQNGKAVIIDAKSSMSPADFADMVDEWKLLAPEAAKKIEAIKVKPEDSSPMAYQEVFTKMRTTAQDAVDSFKKNRGLVEKPPALPGVEEAEPPHDMGRQQFGGMEEEAVPPQAPKRPVGLEQAPVPPNIGQKVAFDSGGEVPLPPKKPAIASWKDIVVTPENTSAWSNIGDTPEERQRLTDHVKGILSQFGKIPPERLGEVTEKYVDDTLKRDKAFQNNTIRANMVKLIIGRIKEKAQEETAKAKAKEVTAKLEKKAPVEKPRVANADPREAELAALIKKHGISYKDLLDKADPEYGLRKSGAEDGGDGEEPDWDYEADKATLNRLAEIEKTRQLTPEESSEKKDAKEYVELVHKNAGKQSDIERAGEVFRELLRERGHSDWNDYGAGGLPDQSSLEQPDSLYGRLKRGQVKAAEPIQTEPIPEPVRLNPIIPAEQPKPIEKKTPTELTPAERLEVAKTNRSYSIRQGRHASEILASAEIAGTTFPVNDALRDIFTRHFTDFNTKLRDTFAATSGEIDRPKTAREISNLVTKSKKKLLDEVTRTKVINPTLEDAIEDLGNFAAKTFNQEVKNLKELSKDGDKRAQILADNFSTDLGMADESAVSPETTITSSESHLVSVRQAEAKKVEGARTVWQGVTRYAKKVSKPVFRVASRFFDAGGPEAKAKYDTEAKACEARIEKIQLEYERTVADVSAKIAALKTEYDPLKKLAADLNELEKAQDARRKALEESGATPEELDLACAKTDELIDAIKASAPDQARAQVKLLQPRYTREDAARQLLDRTKKDNQVLAVVGAAYKRTLGWAENYLKENEVFERMIGGGKEAAMPHDEAVDRQDALDLASRIYNYAIAKKVQLKVGGKSPQDDLASEVINLLWGHLPPKERYAQVVEDRGFTAFNLESDTLLGRPIGDFLKAKTRADKAYNQRVVPLSKSELQHLELVREIETAKRSGGVDIDEEKVAQALGINVTSEVEWLASTYSHSDKIKLALEHEAADNPRLESKEIGKLNKLAAGTGPEAAKAKRALKANAARLRRQALLTDAIKTANLTEEDFRAAGFTEMWAEKKGQLEQEHAGENSIVNRFTDAHQITRMLEINKRLEESLLNSLNSFDQNAIKYRVVYDPASKKYKLTIDKGKSDEKGHIGSMVQMAELRETMLRQIRSEIIQFLQYQPIPLEVKMEALESMSPKERAHAALQGVLSICKFGSEAGRQQKTATMITKFLDSRARASALLFGESLPQYYERYFHGAVDFNPAFKLYFSRIFNHAGEQLRLHREFSERVRNTAEKIAQEKREARAEEEVTSGKEQSLKAWNTAGTEKKSVEELFDSREGSNGYRTDEQLEDLKEARERVIGEMQANENSDEEKIFLRDLVYAGTKSSNPEGSLLGLKPGRLSLLEGRDLSKLRAEDEEFFSVQAQRQANGIRGMSLYEPGASRVLLFSKTGKAPDIITFIHEHAHGFLDDLTFLARTSKAQTYRDAVFSFLGVAPGEKPTHAQAEKFAYTVEKYLYDKGPEALKVFGDNFGITAKIFENIQDRMNYFRDIPSILKPEVGADQFEAMRTVLEEGFGLTPNPYTEESLNARAKKWGAGLSEYYKQRCREAYERYSKDEPLGAQRKEDRQDFLRAAWNLQEERGAERDFLGKQISEEKANDAGRGTTDRDDSQDNPDAARGIGIGGGPGIAGPGSVGSEGATGATGSPAGNDSTGAGSPGAESTPANGGRSGAVPEFPETVRGPSRGPKEKGTDLVEVLGEERHPFLDSLKDLWDVKTGFVPGLAERGRKLGRYFYSTLLERVAQIDNKYAKQFASRGVEGTYASRKVRGHIDPELRDVQTRINGSTKESKKAAEDLRKLIRIGDGAPITVMKALAEGFIPAEELLRTGQIGVEAVDAVQSQQRLWNKISLLCEQVGLKIYDPETGAWTPYKANTAMKIPRVFNDRYYDVVKEIAHGAKTPAAKALIDALKKSNPAKNEAEIEGYFKNMSEAVTRGVSAEFMREIENMPDSIMVGKESIDLMDRDPFTLWTRFAEKHILRLGFISKFGQDTMDTKVGMTDQPLMEDKPWSLKAMIDLASGGNHEAREEIESLVRAMNGLPALGQRHRPDVGTKAYRAMEWFDAAWSVSRAFRLSRSAVPNIPETLGNTLSYAGWNRYKQAIKEVAKDPEQARIDLAREGYFTYDIMNKMADSGRQADSFRRIVSDFVLHNTGNRPMNEINELVAAMAAKIFVGDVQAGKVGTLDKARLGALGFDEAQVGIMTGKIPAKAGVREKLLDMAGSSFARVTNGAGAFAAERSLASNNPFWNKLFFADAYVQMKMNSSLTLLQQMFSKQTGGWKDRTAAAALFGQNFAGTLASAGVAAGLRNFLTGGAKGNSVFFSELEDDKLRSLGVLYLQGMNGGAVDAMLSIGTDEGDSARRALGKIDGLGFFYNVKDYFTKTGIYKDMTPLAASIKYMQTQVPIMTARPAASTLAILGLGEPKNVLLDGGIQGYYRWRDTIPDKGIRTQVTGDMSDETKNLRQKLRSVYVALKNGAPNEQLDVLLKAAVGAGEPDKVRSSLMGKRLLSPKWMTPELKESLKNRIGAEAYAELERHDQLIEEWARRI